jgi:hypothetical protein
MKDIFSSALVQNPGLAWILAVRNSVSLYQNIMCGIIAYVGPREVRSVLLDGLSRLEYRGYDSAGLAS